MTFEQLYRTYFDDVHRFALWLSRSPSEADDLAAETFVRAWGQRHRLRTETLKAYLLAVARNTYLSQQRKAARRAELPADWPDAAPDPDRRATARVDLEHVRRAIARLSEGDRTALVLRAENSLPYAEIARVIGISEGAARLRVHRARRRLLNVYLNRGGA